MATGELTMRSKFAQLPPLGANDAATASANQEGEQSASNKEWEGPPRRNTIDLNYMHRPPTILPNYGKRKGVLKLKTNLPRVLLFDNVTQQTMLDVELSSLQSQRHKADRELSLQARSFMLRRQFKQRFLKNLTKVIHGDDYREFEREYFRLPTNECQRKEAWPGVSPPPNVKNDGQHFLPRLHNGRDGELDMLGQHHPNHPHSGASPPVKPSRGQKLQSNGLSNARWSAADANGKSRRGRDGHQNNSSKDGQREFSLPQINVSPPHTSPQGSTPSELLQFSPPRKVGFRIEKNSSGITRIFHAHDNAEGDEAQHQNAMDPKAAAPPVVEDKGNEEDGKDNTPNNEDEDKRAQEHKEKAQEQKSSGDSKPDADPFQESRRFKNFRKITNPHVAKEPAKEENAPVLKPVEEEVKREFPLTTDQPTLDHRFKGLNKLLVKQEPPNDGYIELSPSCVRDGPIHQLQHRIKELHLDGSAAARGRDGSARSFEDNDSRSMTPDLSDNDV